MTVSESEKTSEKRGGTEEDFDVDPPPPMPLDGGWGWMVVAASLVCNIIVDGVCFSFGIFYVEFLDYFGESKAKTAWVGSLVPGMYLGVGKHPLTCSFACMTSLMTHTHAHVLSAGPIVSALANKFGCRSVTIVGSVCASISFFLSTFSPNINYLILTYGIMGGEDFKLPHSSTLL